MVQGPNESFSAALKGFKQHQTMNKGLAKHFKIHKKVEVL